MKLVINLLLLIFIVSCATKQEYHGEYTVGALNYSQLAAEARALYHQGYNIATDRLERDLLNKSLKRRAVVLDLDETVLDNTPYQAWAVLNNVPFPGKIMEWMNSGEAKALPGSLDFVRFATQSGVEVFYVSNRTIDLLEGTITNLKNEGFPFKRENILLQEKGRSKKGRRDEILKGYEIVLLLGDSLIDFSEYFEKGDEEERNRAVTEFKNQFGRRFIAFPNPLYGDWDPGIKSGRDFDKVREARFKALKPAKVDLK